MSIFYGLAARADHDRMTFARQRKDAGWVELERSKPLRPIFRDVLEGLGLAAFIAAAYMAPQIITKL